MNNDQNMRQAYFHEDDFCQIEILPIENLSFCLEQCGLISEFSEKHKNGIGWDKVFERTENPKEISDLSIKLDDLRKSFQNKLPEYKEVYTGYSSQRTLCKHTFAFGKDDHETLFFQVEDGIVTAIWCSDPSTDLLLLPNHENLLLADWGWEFICPLSDTGRLSEYLTEREKVFAEMTEKWNEERKLQKKKWWKFW